jgi:hypothetical protein
VSDLALPAIQDTQRGEGRAVEEVSKIGKKGSIMSKDTNEEFIRE